MFTFLELGNYGRLGNQLFQIAATIGIATSNNQPYIFPDWKYSPCFKLPISPLCELKNARKWRTIQEPSFIFCSEIKDRIMFNDEDISLNGYFQSEKYFDHCKELIRNTFLNDYVKYLQEHDMPKCDNKCAIHVRLGDYTVLQKEYVQLINTSYYKDAIEYMLKHNIKQFNVFSDDTYTCSKYFSVILKDIPDITIDYVYTNKTDIFDLMFMAKHNYHIMANSSFSWWGSWLAIDSLTITPKQWFGPALNLDTKDLYRDGMVLL